MTVEEIDKKIAEVERFSSFIPTSKCFKYQAQIAELLKMKADLLTK